MGNPIDPRDYQEPQQNPKNPPPPPQMFPSNEMMPNDANVLALNELRTRVRRALETAWHAGQMDGAHHKAWVIDQMVHHLLIDGYDAYIAHYKNNGEYDWDKGTPP